MAAKDILLALKKFVFSTNVEHLFRQANSYKLLKKDFTKVSKVGYIGRSTQFLNFCISFRLLLP